MNPLAQLDYFLSIDGLNSLRTKFVPPQGAFAVKYVKDEDTYHFLIYVDEINEERKGTFTFVFLLKSELMKLLKNVRQAIEARIFSIDSIMDRNDFVDTITSKLDQIVSNWIHTSISSKHPEIEEMLREFRAHIESNLLPYTKTIQQRPKLGQEIDLEIPLKLPERKDMAEALDIRQSALLFHYLKQHKAILNYTNTSLAKILHVLTGHSEHRIRTEEGFGAIGYIMNDKKKDGNFQNEQNYNLTAVRKLLANIINDIDKQIADNNKNQKL